MRVRVCVCKKASSYQNVNQRYQENYLILPQQGVITYMPTIWREKRKMAMADMISIYNYANEIINNINVNYMALSVIRARIILT